jgi:hypothetical protein
VVVCGCQPRNHSLRHIIILPVPPTSGLDRTDLAERHVQVAYEGSGSCLLGAQSRGCFPIPVASLLLRMYFVGSLNLQCFEEKNTCIFGPEKGNQQEVPSLQINRDCATRVLNTETYFVGSDTGVALCNSDPSVPSYCVPECENQKKIRRLHPNLFRVSVNFPTSA